MYAQKFNFESDKKLKTEFNKKIAEALDGDDVKLMKKILDKDPSLVNSSSKMTAPSKHSVLAAGKIPLLYDAVDRCLYEKHSVEMVKLILKYDPFMYCVFDDLTPFYLVLEFIATHKIEECQNAENLFYLFCNKPNFDVNQLCKGSPLPLSFLISRNYYFNRKSYSKEYISSDIIKTLIEKGASVNTRDDNSNSILTYSVITERPDLFSYCISKGADVSITNKDNRDALYFAVSKNNSQHVSTLLNSKYPLSEDRLALINAYTCIPYASSEIKNIIFDKLKTGVKNLEKMKIITRLYPDKRLYFISEQYKRTNFNITTEQIPDFISLFSNLSIDNNSTAYKNLYSLKEEYILSSKNIKEFVSRNTVFPLYVLKNYSETFYKSEKISTDLINEISEINTIPQNLKKNLISEVENTTKTYYEKTIETNSIDELASLFLNFPSKSSDIEKIAFDKFIKDANTGYIGYKTDDDSDLILAEKRKVATVISNCSTFIETFNNPEYIAIANNKLQQCSDNHIILSRTHNQAVNYYNQLSRRYHKAFNQIVKNGKTPSYEIIYTEVSDDGKIIYYEIKVWDVAGSGSFKVGIRNKNNNYCEYDNGFLESIFGPFDSNCSKTLDEKIRKICIKKCRIENNNFYHMKRITEFLERNIHGRWYEKVW